MSLTLKTQRDGKTLRSFWYGQFQTNNKRQVVNLNIPWRGIPPTSGTIRDPGDADFEASRKEAEKELARVADEAARKGRVEHLTERLIEMKTGRAIEYAKLADLADRWERLPRRHKLTPRHAAVCRTRFKQFIDFMATRNPKTQNLYEVKAEDATAFISATQAARSMKTARDVLSLLRSAFEHFKPRGTENPFRDLVIGDSKGNDNGEDETIHRAALTTEQITTLLDYARKHDPLLCDMITAGICSGLRRGDLCRLPWTSVDFKEGMLRVKTSKTGAEVDIPLFNPLRAILESRRNNGKPFCFPEAEAIYRTQPQDLSWRFKVLAARAFAEPVKALPKRKPTLTPEVIQAAGLKVIDAMPPDERRDQMRKVFTAYMAGQSVRNIEKETGIARSGISYWLHSIEQKTGLSFIRATQPGGMRTDVAKITRLKKEGRKRSGSVIDWHCLRTSFVTIALSAGVPVELVKKITGHASVEIILKHYFKPGREQFRAALSLPLPDVLTGKKTKAKPADEIAAIAGKLADGTATDEDKKRFRKLAAQV
jgi:integrase